MSTTSSATFANTTIGPLDFTGITATETDTGDQYVSFTGGSPQFGAATLGTAPTFTGVQWGAFSAGTFGDSTGAGALQEQVLSVSYDVSAAPGGAIFGIDGQVIGPVVTANPGVTLSAVETLTDSAGKVVDTFTWNPVNGENPQFLSTGYANLQVNLTITASIYNGGADTSADEVIYSGIQQTFVAGSVSIDKQVSVDGKTWYDVGSGVLNDPGTLVGGTVYYRVVVTNSSTAGVSLANASIGDANGPGPFTFGGSDTFTLDAGATLTSDVMTATAVAGHQIDTASLTGVFTDGTHTVAASASDTADYTGLAPTVSIDKQVSVNGTTWYDVGSGVLNDPTTAAGSPVYFRVVVDNTSPAGVTLDNAAVADSGGLPAFTFGGGQSTFTLDAGATLTSDVMTATAVAGHEIDTATLTGTFVDGSASAAATASDTADYSGVSQQVAAVTVDKQVSVNGTTWVDVGSGVLNDPSVLAGCNVYFRVLVTNTSAAAITGAGVVDSNGTRFDFGTGTTATIAAGATVTSDVVTMTAQAGHQIDTATMTGTETLSGQTISVTGSDTADYTGLQSGLSVLKLPGSVVVSSGGQETYTFYVTNTGTTALTNVTITDNIGTAANPEDVTPTAVTSGGYNVGDTNHNGVLDPGEVWKYTETVTVSAGGSGQSGGGSQTYGGAGCDTSGGQQSGGQQSGGQQSGGQQSGGGSGCDTSGGQQSSAQQSGGSQWGGQQWGGQSGCDTSGGQQSGGQQSGGSQWGGQQSDGQQSDGQQSDGQQSGGQQSGGQSGCDTSGGQQSGGQQSGGSQWGGQQWGGQQSGGQSGCDTSGGQQSGGQQSGGSQWGGQQWGGQQSGGQSGCDTSGGQQSGGQQSGGSQWGGQQSDGQQSGGQSGCDTSGGQQPGGQCSTPASTSLTDTVTITATAVNPNHTSTTCATGQGSGGSGCSTTGDQSGGSQAGGSQAGGSCFGWSNWFAQGSGGSWCGTSGGSQSSDGSFNWSNWSGWGSGSACGTSGGDQSGGSQSSDGSFNWSNWSGWGSGSGTSGGQQSGGTSGCDTSGGQQWGGASGCDTSGGQQSGGASGCDTSGGQQSGGDQSGSACGCTQTVTATDSKEIQVLGAGSNITLNGTAPTGNLPALFGTAEKLEFAFTPGDTVSLATGSATLAAVTGNTPSASAFLEITNNSNPTAAGAQIYFEGNVTSGEDIFADATVNPLTGALVTGAAGQFSTASGAELHAFVYASQQAFQSGAAPEQTLAYGTAGQMHLGDTVGSLQLAGYVGTTGGHLVG